MSPTSEPLNAVLPELITQLKRNLDAARTHGDQLQIDLAEAALNSALEQLSQVTK